jgi:hypothetical protein
MFQRESHPPDPNSVTFKTGVAQSFVGINTLNYTVQNPEAPHLSSTCDENLNLQIHTLISDMILYKSPWKAGQKEI